MREQLKMPLGRFRRRTCPLFTRRTVENFQLGYSPARWQRRDHHDICVLPGVIESISGVEKIEEIPGVISVNLRYGVGDSVSSEANVGRRFAEINFLARDYAEALKTSEKIQATLSVIGDQGDMKISSFADGFSKWIDLAESEQGR